MKKGWLISSVVIVAILLFVGNMMFETQVEEANEDGIQTEQEEPVVIDENGNPVEQDASSESRGGHTVSAAMKDDSQGEDGITGNRVIADGDQSQSNVGGAVTAGEASNSSTTEPSATRLSSNDPNRSVSNNSGGGSGSSATQERPARDAESVTAIKNRYFPEFQQIEWEQNGKLEGLIQRAFDDYMTDQKAFNSSKYRSEAQAMQASADSAFYGKYGKMQEELAANGHSRQAAADFEQTYLSKKAAREQELQEIVNGL